MTCSPVIMRLIAVAFATALQVASAADGTQAPSGNALREIRYDDLIELIDLGASPEMDFDGLAVSPDQKFVAVETVQNSISSNLIETRWRLIALHGDHKSTDAGRSGEPTLVENRLPQRPVWLRNSKWIVYRAKFGTSMQLWRSRVDGERQEQLTWAPAGVSAFVLSSDGQRLVYATQEPEAPSSTTTDESARGYLYDNRFAPFLSTRPLDDEPGSGAHRKVWVYDIDRGMQRPASEADRKELEVAYPLAPSDVEPPVRWRRVAKAAPATVWLEDARGRDQADPEKPLTVVHTGPKSSAPMRCTHERCTGYFKGLWISDDGQTVYFLRWAGPYSYGPFGLYAWRSADSTVHEILRTYDSLEACAMLPMSLLLCSHETATTPKDLTMIDLNSGAREVVFDPNPQFQQIRFGEVVPLTWHDGNGVEAYGRLVKPVGYVPGKRYPLVIVQYRSRGFLRGGTGDECPIHVLSSKGFAVLSFHRPEDWDVIADYTSVEDAEIKFWRDLHDRRRVVSALRAGVRVLDDMGVVDLSRVGIHGLSDGANTAGYLLIHFPREFAAASVAGTHWSPMLYHLFGPKLQDRMRWFGLPFPGYERPQPAWQRISIAMNAKTIQTPILIQAADSELLPETETFSALQTYNKPVEMHVFPDEFHIKVQPIHRLNIYKRNAQWFQFWLQNIEDPHPVDADQYARWRDLRVLQVTSLEQGAREVTATTAGHLPN